MNKASFLFFLFYLSCHGLSEKYTWVDTLPNPWTLSEKEFEKFLPQFQLRFPNYLNRIKALNIWRLDTPYGLYCLGEEVGEDKDPIIRNDSSDCTVHVLTTMAFAESSNYKEAKQAMQKIHYKKDEVGLNTPNYKSRWHFTLDRLLNNPKTIDITSSLVETDSLEIVIIELNRKENGEEFLKLNWTLKEKLNFIPIEKLNKNILNKLPEACGVAFIKKNYFKLGIAVAHEGFIVDNSILFHASSDSGKTVKVDLMNYIQVDNKYRFDGVMFFSINNT